MWALHVGHDVGPTGGRAFKGKCDGCQTGGLAYTNHINHGIRATCAKPVHTAQL